MEFSNQSVLDSPTTNQKHLLSAYMVPRESMFSKQHLGMDQRKYVAPGIHIYSWSHLTVHTHVILVRKEGVYERGKMYGASNQLKDELKNAHIRRMLKFGKVTRDEDFPP